MILFVLLSILYVASAFQQKITKTRGEQSLFYTPLIRFQSPPQSSSIQEENETKTKPNEENFLAHFQKNVRSKAPLARGNEGMDVLDGRRLSTDVLAKTQT